MLHRIESTGCDFFLKKRSVTTGPQAFWYHLSILIAKYQCASFSITLIKHFSFFFYLTDSVCLISFMNYYKGYE